MTIDSTFERLVDITSHLGDQVPKNHPKRGVNRHFQAKLAKHKNRHIIETTAPIPTKFCAVTKTNKYSSWVVQIHVTQIQDGKRSTS